MQRSYSFALACGAVPLIAGTAFYLLWLVTRWEFLPTVGVAVLLIGVLLFIAGCVALGQFTWRALQTPGIQRARLWKAVVIAATVLLANLPVAAGLVGQVILDETRHTILVENQTGIPLENVRITGAGKDVHLGTIAPGSSLRQVMRYPGEGSVSISAQLGQHSVLGTVHGYVSSGKGAERTVVRVQPDGSVMLERKDFRGPADRPTQGAAATPVTSGQ